MRFLFFIFLASFAIASHGDVTFKVDDVEDLDRAVKMFPVKTALSGMFEGRIEGYKIPVDEIRCSVINAFVDAVKTSYDRHMRLEIRPDDIWLLVCQGVAIHVNEKPALLKSAVLKDKNQEILNLSVRRDDFVRGEDNPWEEFVADLTRQVGEYVRPEVSRLFAPEFSTTTPECETVFKMTLLKTTDRYFEYDLRTLCGIPEITLRGTPEDWTLLREKMRLLDGLGLDWWARALVPIIDEFVAAAKGAPNRDFWKTILKGDRDSGKPLCLSGWIINFFPYLVSNADKFYRNPYVGKAVPEPGLEANVLPKGTTHARFKWNYLEDSYDMEMCAGFMGINIDQKKTVRPVIGWMLKEYTPPRIIEGMRGSTAARILLASYGGGVLLVLVAVTARFFMSKRTRREKLISLSNCCLLKIVILAPSFFLTLLLLQNIFEFWVSSLDIVFGKNILYCNFFDYVPVFVVVKDCLLSTTIIVLMFYPYENKRLNMILTLLGAVAWVGIHIVSLAERSFIYKFMYDF